MDIDLIISKVASKKENWAHKTATEKLNYIEKIQNNLVENMHTLNNLSYEKRTKFATENGVQLNSEQKGYIMCEGFTFSTLIISIWLYVLNKTYKILSTTGAMPKVEAFDTHKNGTKKVKVGGHETLTNLLFPFCESEIIIEGELTQTPPTNKPAGVSTILGAGNQEGVTDLLHGLFNLNHVCIYKMSPISTQFLDVFNDIFKPLVDDGFLYIVAGGADVGQQMINNELVDSIIMTGSSTTASQIMWGSPKPPPRSSNQTPLISKSFLFEAGNCTPWIIAPGKWSTKEIEAQCSHLAYAMTANGGQVCGHPQIVITCKNWPQRDMFLKCLKTKLQKAPIITAYYPNYQEKFDDIQNKLKNIYENDFFLFHSKIEAKQTSAPDPIKNIIFCTDMPTDSFFLNQEAFCCASAELPLNTENDISKFLEIAIPFINKNTTGNLCATISGPKPTNKNEELAYEEAMMNLKFGSVNFNLLPVFEFSTPFAIWGAQNDMDIYDLESGHGVLGNCYGIENIKKSTVKASARNLVSMLMSMDSILSYNKTYRLFTEMAKILCYQKWSQFHLYIYHSFKLALRTII